MLQIGKNIISSTMFYPLIWFMSVMVFLIAIILVSEKEVSKPKDIKIKDDDKVLIVDRWVTSIEQEKNWMQYAKFHTVRDTFPKKLVVNGYFRGVFEDDGSFRKIAKIQTSSGMQYVEIDLNDYLYLNERKKNSFKYLGRKCKVEHLDYPNEDTKKLVFIK